MKMNDNYIPEIEKASEEDIKKFQENLLTINLEYLKTHSQFYRELFSKNKIDVSKIKKIEDLQHIPLTTKDDLQTNNNKFVFVEKNKIIDYITTSGTLGDPVVIAMTDKDLERLAYNECINFICADGSSKDIYQLMTTIDRRFMAGLAYFLGVRKLGAGIIRVGNGIPELQWDSINRISPTTLISVPSFILKIIEYAETHGIDYRNTSISKAVCIGEPLRNSDFSLNLLGNRIKEKWDIKLFSTYASSEMGTAFTECSEGMGGHHHPELIIVEFLDDNDNPVHEGETGELTITNLGVEGTPLLRFKTGDICNFHSQLCSCGRNTIRLGPIVGRKNQMIKLKGTSLYPPAIYDVLDNIIGIENYIVEVYTNNIGTDEILIKIGAKETDNNFLKMIKDNFRAKLRVTPDIIFEHPVEIHKLQELEINRKPRKFIDNRKIYRNADF
jgi:phenylacetate-CoA ligase